MAYPEQVPLESLHVIPSPCRISRFFMRLTKWLNLRDTSLGSSGKKETVRLAGEPDPLLRAKPLPSDIHLDDVEELTIPSPLEGASRLRRDSKRETWSGKLQFFLTCMGYCVGFGNIWRFPFLVYRNGGGAFLIPYVLFLVLCGIPLVFMEMGLGQFSSLTPVFLFGRFSPLFKGLGYSMVTISFFVCIYYNTIMSWVIYYLYSSFTWVLPWSRCDADWSSSRCYSPFDSPNTTEDNATLTGLTGNRSRIPASEEFWNRHVLGLSDSIDEMGTIRPHLVVCLAVAWISVFFCSCKGIKSTGKVVYATATFPVVMLLVLFARGISLPGSMQGVRLFLLPDFARLADFRVWIDAAMQIFYAMAPGWGGLMSFASYNEFRVDIYKYAVVIPVINLLTSLLGGLAVFSVVGYLSYQSGLPPDQVVAQGPGLTFVAYPEALAQMPFAPFWSVLFFLTLFTIGIDSQFGMFETFLSALAEEFRLVKRYRVLFCGASCCLLFVLGLVCVTEAGMYWVQIIDWYCAFLTLLLICAIECFLVGWIYGADWFRRDIEMMVGYPLSRMWSWAWKYVTLFTVLSILFFTCYFHTPIIYHDYVFPAWSVTVGWSLAISSMLPIPGYAVYTLWRSRGQGLSIWQSLCKNIRPTPEYGPRRPVDRLAYQLDLPLRHGGPLLTVNDSSHSFPTTFDFMA